MDEAADDEGGMIETQRERQNNIHRGTISFLKPHHTFLNITTCITMHQVEIGNVESTYKVKVDFAS